MIPLIGWRGGIIFAVTNGASSARLTIYVMAAAVRLMIEIGGCGGFVLRVCWKYSSLNLCVYIYIYIHIYIPLVTLAIFMLR